MDHQIGFAAVVAVVAVEVVVALNSIGLPPVVYSGFVLQLPRLVVAVVVAEIKKVKDLVTEE